MPLPPPPLFSPPFLSPHPRLSPLSPSHTTPHLNTCMHACLMPLGSPEGSVQARAGGAGSCSPAGAQGGSVSSESCSGSWAAGGAAHAAAGSAHGLAQAALAAGTPPTHHPTGHTRRPPVCLLTNIIARLVAIPDQLLTAEGVKLGTVSPGWQGEPIKCTALAQFTPPCPTSALCCAYLHSNCPHLAVQSTPRAATLS